MGSIFNNLQYLPQIFLSAQVLWQEMVKFTMRLPSQEYRENNIDTFRFRSIIDHMDSVLLKRVLGSLRGAEASLQKVIAEAAAEGEYGVARLTSEAAEAVRRIRNQLDQTSDQDASRAISSPIEPVSTNRVVRATTAAERKEPNQKKPEPAVRAPKKGIYPRFEVRQDMLYRYGWSKREKQEYVHKVPHSMYARTVNALDELRKGGSGPFMAEILLKHMENVEEAVPSYQVYVVLGLLREAGCVEQVGREGYNIPPDVSEKANKAWAELSAKAKA